VASSNPGAGTIIDQEGGFLSRLTHPYTERKIAPIYLGNSNRLDALMRGGRIYLSLQDAIALALENNLDIELARYGPRIAEADLLRAKAGGLLRGVPTGVQVGPGSARAQVLGTGGGAAGVTFGGGGGGGGGTGAGGTVITQTGPPPINLDPVIFVNSEWGHQSTPLSNTVTTGTTSLVSDTSSFTAGISQGFVTGTTMSLFYNTDTFRSNNVQSSINPGIQGSASLNFRQRLLQGFGSAVNSRNIKIAKNNLRVSDLAFRQQVIETVSAIIGLYWDLVSMNADVRVRKQAVELAEKLYNDNRKQVEIGTLAPIEIVRAEAEVARSQQELTNAETQLLQQETIIKNALSRSGTAAPAIADARLVPTDQIRMPEVESVQPIQDLVALAIQNRPDVTQTQLQIENTKIGIEGSRSQLRPSLDLIAQMRNNALAGSVNTLPPTNPLVPIVRNVDPFFLGGFPSVLGQVFSRNFPDYSIGFQLNVPLRNRSAQADMIRDSLTLRQQEIREQQMINNIRVNVQNSLIALQQARAQFQAAEKNRILQEQTLDAEQKKYALGASTIFFVIQAQRDLAQAQATEVTALSAYARARNNLEAATGQTLTANSIEIDEAVSGSVSRPPALIPAVPPQQP
jgi:outer membrane protein TolC